MYLCIYILVGTRSSSEVSQISWYVFVVISMVLVLCEVRKIVVFLFEVSQIPGINTCTIVEVNKIKVYKFN